MVQRLPVLAAVACVLPVCALRSSGSATVSLQVTPVEKVISLLGKISMQIEEEGKNEAAEYDKYACFCKEQLDSKTYAIEKSEEKIEVLTAKIAKLDADITELLQQVTQLSTEITGLEGDISAEEATRAADHAAYLTSDANITGAIKAVEGALKAFEESKSQLVDTKLDLTQVRAATGEALKAMSLAPQFGTPNGELVAASALLEQASQAEPGKPQGYEYQSNDVIDTLKTLLMQFKARKKSLFDDEYALRTVSEKKVLGLTNEKTFKEKEKTEKEAIADAKSEEKSAAESDKQAEEQAKTADEEFRGELQSQCEEKAKEWDQRSKTRAEELTAISEATEILKSGVNPVYGANRRLVGLQQQQGIFKPKWQDQVSGHGIPVALLQEVQEHKSAASAAEVAGRALRLLDNAAGRLGSARLTALASKLALQADHFEKVRGLISDLIARLEAEAEAEATSKTECDTQMGEATSNRDAQKLNMEKEAAIISEKEAEKAQLTSEIATLSQEIADLSKALNERAELRAEEKADNARTVADAGAGKAAVQEAISILQAFYGSLLQYTPPNSDREGKTVGDRAPELSYSGEYKGKTEASKGVIGLLEVILSDFERTESTVGSAETAAQSEFEAFETATNTDIGTKRSEKETKETAVETAEGALVDAQNAKMTAERLHKSFIEELEKLSSMCVEGEESWSERKAKREQEIEALKQALKILEEWQG
mmetsp:Transcript_135866/g.378636  ORF Transcript_135866/g.378636 Transcript_135866/m.378636 type:complete len:716 (+) Transcript_135866:72-2219(+)